MKEKLRPVKIKLHAWRAEIGDDIKSGISLAIYEQAPQSDSGFRVLPFNETEKYYCFGGIHAKLNPMQIDFLAHGHTASSGSLALPSEYLLLYNRETNSVRLNIRYDEISDLPVVPHSEETRGSYGWDRIEININLDSDGTIKQIDFPPYRNPRRNMMALSRTMIGCILAATEIPQKYPRIYAALKDYLVPQESRHAVPLEKINNLPVPISMLTRANTGAPPLTLHEASRVLGFVHYKSSVIRRLALDPLKKLTEQGLVPPEKYHRYLRKTLCKDIEEDIRFVDRALKQDSDLMSRTFATLFGQSSVPEELELELKFLDKGMNKQVYMLRPFAGERLYPVFMMSTIREAPFTSGFPRADIDEATRLWQKYSDRGCSEIPKLACARWFIDYRPRILDQPINTETLSGYDVKNWMYWNNIMIISREFVEGPDLDFFLRNTDDRNRRNAGISAVIAAHFSFWMNNLEDQQGPFIRDPKPLNSVVIENDQRCTARIIDLDRLTTGSLPELLAHLEPFYSRQLISEAADSVGIGSECRAAFSRK